MARLEYIDYIPHRALVLDHQVEWASDQSLLLCNAVPAVPKLDRTVRSC
jgi:hypothetical protein